MVDASWWGPWRIVNFDCSVHYLDPTQQTGRIPPPVMARWDEQELSLYIAVYTAIPKDYVKSANIY